MSDAKIRVLWDALTPYNLQRLHEAKTKGFSFAHYTSAANALSIIKNKNVWMRNASEMNDFSEISHGHSCLKAAWDDRTQGARIKGLLESVEGGLVERLGQAYNERFYDRARRTFMLSVSEHGQGVIDENQYGRLSMWRAYGGNTNVALVLSSRPFLSETSATQAYTSPVFYGDQSMFIQEFTKVVDAFEENLTLARELGGDAVKSLFENIFHFSVLSTKHPGFSEEREWRVIYSPSLFAADKINLHLEVVNGVPQQVYKFPLVDYPSEGLIGVTLPDLLERVIIGPTNSAETIAEALGLALMQEGVQDWSDRVSLSKIPLRR